MKEQQTTTLTLPVTDRDHVQGSAAAVVTLVEYGGFECPHCAAAFPMVELLRKQQGERLRFVFRHFPLNESHPHAESAAEAAGAQNRFGEMHETLFANQDALASSNLTDYAERLGIDSTWFSEAMAACTFEEKGARRLHERRPERSKQHADILRERCAPRRRTQSRFAHRCCGRKRMHKNRVSTTGH